MFRLSDPVERPTLAPGLCRGCHHLIDSRLASRVPPPQNPLGLSRRVVARLLARRITSDRRRYAYDGPPTPLASLLSRVESLRPPPTLPPPPSPSLLSDGMEDGDDDAAAAAAAAADVSDVNETSDSDW